MRKLWAVGKRSRLATVEALAKFQTWIRFVRPSIRRIRDELQVRRTGGAEPTARAKPTARAEPTAWSEPTAPAGMEPEPATPAGMEPLAAAKLRIRRI